MKQEQKAEIIQLWKEHGESYTAPDAISYKTGIGRGRIKAIIDAHKRGRIEELVTYRIMKRKRQGLRLVRMRIGGDTMDWYTDKDEDGIEAYANQLRRRLIGETA